MVNLACENNNQNISYKMNSVGKHDRGEAKINIVISKRMTT